MLRMVETVIFFLLFFMSQNKYSTEAAEGSKAPLASLSKFEPRFTNKFHTPSSR